MVSPTQIKMARAGLGISVRVLAERSKVAESTIHRFEANKGGMHASTLDRLTSALEAAGATFVPADAHGGPGVRLKA
ncbi:MAG: XRE family transcriptional regulator [Hyphomicrobiales bacterium]|nr:MAG: XRE family transcriptional regulator [Hyphomicrobiales bacterium]